MSNVTMDDVVTYAARAAHEALRAYDIMHGRNAAKPWKSLSRAQRTKLREGVHAVMHGLETHDSTPRTQLWANVVRAFVVMTEVS